MSPTVWQGGGAPGEPCPYGDCAGRIGDTGYCGTCGRRQPRTTERFGGRESTQTTRRLGAELYTLPEIVTPDPADRIMVNPDVPEESRFCGNCDTAVGRAYAGQPAETEGFCHACGTPFSFSVKLRAGDVVDRRYEVLGVLGRGGFGWVYLARELRLGTHVALKGLLNTGDNAAARLALNETQRLTTLDHPNIVRIITVVEHDQNSYIVLEYVGGPTLRDLKRAAQQGDDRTLPIDQVIGYGMDILVALGYLHDRGLLYCDMKPDNVIHSGSQIKLVDMGGIRSVDDHTSPAVGSDPYQVSRAEIAEHGLTVRSDLHTVGVTLDKLFQASDCYTASPTTGGVESFRRIVARATDDYHRRFRTAGEMRGQLAGVLREILAERTRKPHPAESAVFAETAAPLDGGLGEVPTLRRWLSGGPLGADLAHPPPSAPEAAVQLPAPRPDPADPAAEFLDSVRAPDAERLLTKLNTWRGDSVEHELRRCRALIELGRLADARLSLTAAERRGARGDDWRIAWHEGLLALANDDPADAQPWFDRTYTAWPGEDAPKLALGLCAELTGRRRRAAAYYETSRTRDHAQAGAAFGLARVRLAEDDPAGAVAVLEQIPQISRHYDVARIAAVRIRVGRLASGRTPGPAEFAEAVDQLRWLYLDNESRDRLEAVICESTVDCMRSGAEEAYWHAVRSLADGHRPEQQAGPGRLGRIGALVDRLRADGHRELADRTILAKPPTEAIRLLLARYYRRLAQQATSGREHGQLIDLAHRVRPKTLV